MSSMLHTYNYTSHVHVWYVTKEGWVGVGGVEPSGIAHAQNVGQNIEPLSLIELGDYRCQKLSLIIVMHCCYSKSIPAVEDQWCSQDN